MAELVILVCDKCGGQKDVAPVQIVRRGQKSKAELCDKCFKEMSASFSFAHPPRGWAKKEIVDFDSIKRNKP